MRPGIRESCSQDSSDKKALAYSITMAVAAAVASQHGAAGHSQPYKEHHATPLRLCDDHQSAGTDSCNNVDSDAMDIDIATLDPLLAQAESIQHAAISNTNFSPLAHLREPIPSFPTTLPPVSKPPASRLLALPTELHLHIAKFLPWPAQYALKRTNHHFNSLPDLPAPIDFFHQRHRGKAFQQSLLISLCAAGLVRRGYEPCYACRRFRWKTRFEIAQYQRSFLWRDGGSNNPVVIVRDGLGEGHGEVGDVFDNGKFCIDCGVRAGKYAVGERIEVVQEWSDYHSDRQRVLVEEPKPKSWKPARKRRIVKKKVRKTIMGITAEVEIDVELPEEEVSEPKRADSPMEQIDGMADTEFGFSTASEVAQRRLFAFYL